MLADLADTNHYLMGQQLEMLSSSPCLEYRGQQQMLTGHADMHNVLNSFQKWGRRLLSFAAWHECQ